MPLSPMLRIPSRPHPRLHPAMRRQLVKAGKTLGVSPETGWKATWWIPGQALAAGPWSPLGVVESRGAPQAHLCPILVSGAAVHPSHSLQLRGQRCGHSGHSPSPAQPQCWLLHCPSSSALPSAVLPQWFERRPPHPEW